MSTSNRVIPRIDRPAKGRNGLSRERPVSAAAQLAMYLEEEKRKTRVEMSQQLNQWLLPLLNKLDRNTLSRPDLALLLQRKLEELSAQPSALLRRTLSQLSPAEWQVCQRLRLGHRTKQIAEDMHLSPSTVENQRNAIRRKLGLAHSENLVTFLQQL